LLAVCEEVVDAFKFGESELSEGIGVMAFPDHDDELVDLILALHAADPFVALGVREREGNRLFAEIFFGDPDEETVGILGEVEFHAFDEGVDVLGHHSGKYAGDADDGSVLLLLLVKIEVADGDEDGLLLDLFLRGIPREGVELCLDVLDLHTALEGILMVEGLLVLLGGSEELFMVVVLAGLFVADVVQD
jgi:hypothetical protein